MAAAKKKILGCSKTTSNTALRAELGISTLKTNRDMRKLRWQHSVRNMQSKRRPAIVDRAMCKKVPKGQPVRWDKEVERVWQEIGGNKDEVLSTGESAGHKTKVRDTIEIREKGALICKVDKEEHLKTYGGLKEGIGMKAYLHGPMDVAWRNP